MTDADHPAATRRSILRRGLALLGLSALPWAAGAAGAAMAPREMPKRRGGLIPGASREAAWHNSRIIQGVIDRGGVFTFPRGDYRVAGLEFRPGTRSLRVHRGTNVHIDSIYAYDSNSHRAIITLPVA